MCCGAHLPSKGKPVEEDRFKRRTAAGVAVHMGLGLRATMGLRLLKIILSEAPYCCPYIDTFPGQ